MQYIFSVPPWGGGGGGGVWWWCMVVVNGGGEGSESVKSACLSTYYKNPFPRFHNSMAICISMSPKGQH